LGCRGTRRRRSRLVHRQRAVHTTGIIASVARAPDELQEFDADARRAISLAEVEARELGHGRIGTEHLLLGLLANRASGAARLLAGTGTTLAAARSKVNEAVGASQRGIARATHPLPWTPRATRALGRSVRFSHATSADAVSTEHLLWGVLDVEGTAGQVLRGLGLEIEQLRTSLEAVAGPPLPDGTITAAVERDPGMSGAATCPHCSASIHELAYRSVTAYDADRTRRETLVFSCPSCNGALGVTTV